MAFPALRVVDVEDRANRILGHVQVDNFPTQVDPIGVKGKNGTSIATTGNPFPVEVENTVPVSGPLTDTELRASEIPTNIGKWGGTAVSAASNVGDGLSATTTTPVVRGMPAVFNGTSWDRVKSLDASDGDVLHTGVQAVGVHLATGSSLTGGASGDNRSGSREASVVPYAWDGTTFNRLRATIANGLEVDVKRISGTVAVTGPLTDTQLRASAVPVTIPTPVPVTDNGGSLTVDGPLTDSQLRASAVPVTVGNFPSTYDVSDRTGRRIGVVSRPTEASGRTYVHKVLSPGGTAYTVTAGKTLYVTSASLSVAVSAVATASTKFVTDNSVNVLGIPYLGVATAYAIALSFLEPLRFTHDVTLPTDPTGVSSLFTFTGYEE